MSEYLNNSAGDQERRRQHSVRSDEWDAVFADEDPTRVLSPEVEHHYDSFAADETEVLNPRDIEDSHQRNISATRPRKNQSVRFEPDEDRTEALPAYYDESPTRSFDRTRTMDAAPQAYTAPQSHTPPPAQTPSTAQTPPPAYAADYENQPAAGPHPELVAQNSRIHLLPAFLGWLATYSLLTFSDFAMDAVNHFFGVNYPGRFAPAFAQALGLATPSASATSLWVGTAIAATLIFLSAAMGGYAAARMARFAPAKQAIGVWMWHIIMVIAATIVVFIGNVSSGSPRLALQTQLANSLMENILGVLVALALILVGALVGALFGPRYHKRLARNR